MDINSNEKEDGEDEEEEQITGLGLQDYEAAVIGAETLNSDVHVLKKRKSTRAQKSTKKRE